MNILDTCDQIAVLAGQPGSPVELAAAAGEPGPVRRICGAFRALDPERAGLPQQQLELLRACAGLIAAYQWHGLGAAAAECLAALPPPPQPEPGNTVPRPPAPDLIFGS